MAYGTLLGRRQNCAEHLSSETDCAHVCFFFAAARVNRCLLLPLGCMFFFVCFTLPLSSLPPLAFVLNQSLIVHSFSSTNFYTCLGRNTTLPVLPLALPLDEGDSGLV